MNLDIKLNEVEHENLLELYSKVKDFVSYLDNEVKTSEVERKSNV